MTLRLHKTFIYFKQYFASSSLDKMSFYKLCNKIENFPLKKDYSEIKGLYLGGEHFLKKVLFDEAKRLDLDEIVKIKRITPITDRPPMPFIMEHNYFEVNLPTEGKTYEQLMQAILIIERYYDDLLDDVTGSKIEMHLRGGSGGSMSRHLYQKAIPGLPEGVYAYQAIEKQNIASGEMRLPAEFLNLPENIIKFIKVLRDPYTLKLMDNKNKLIIKQIKKQEIGLSFYSDRSEWFCRALRSCKNARLFQEDVGLPEKYRSLPHLTGLQERI